MRGDERGSKKEDREKGISRREIKETIRRLKDGKAANGIPREVWRYGGEEMEKWIEEFLSRIWRG